MFSQVFSLKNIHLSEKKTLWLNGHQILQTQPGWKVRNDIHCKVTAFFYFCRHNFAAVWVLSTCVCTCCLQGAAIFYFLLTQLNSQTLPSPILFEEAVTRLLFFKSTPPLRPVCCVSGFLHRNVKNRALINAKRVLSDPDEVIYDDVPRENSDSNTGLWVFLFVFFPNSHISQIQYCSSCLYSSSWSLSVLLPSSKLFKPGIYFKIILCDCSQLLICMCNRKG